MNDLIIDELPTDVADQLNRRARLSGRTLAEEARVLLIEAMHRGIAPSRHNEPLGCAVNRIVLEEGLSERAWEIFTASLANARGARSDSSHKGVLFEDFDFQDDQAAEGAQ